MLAFMLALVIGMADSKEVRLEGLDVWKKAGDWKQANVVKIDDEDRKRLWAKEILFSNDEADKAKIIFNGVKGNTINLISKEEFGDCEVHVEFMVPQGSNSGVYLMGRYEIQVFDSWGKEKVEHSDCGGIYQRWKDNKGYEGRPPRVNVSKKPGEWQSFDIAFLAPRFDAEGKKLENAKFVKVVHNGVVVHENESLSGPTRASAWDDEKPVGPLMLQGDHGPVAYRNIRVKKLSAK